MGGQLDQHAFSCTREVAIIAAVAKNGVIGTSEGLPWKLPEDLRRFKRITANHTVIMGRKTWESLGATPLPKRENIVVSRSVFGDRRAVKIAKSLADAINLATCPNPIFVIGGENLYREALQIAGILFLTEIERDFAGSVYFPDLDRSQWIEVGRERNLDPDGLAFDFVEYRRTNP